METQTELTPPLVDDDLINSIVDRKNDEKVLNTWFTGLADQIKTFTNKNKDVIENIGYTDFITDYVDGLMFGIDKQIKSNKKNLFDLVEKLIEERLPD